MKIVYLPVLKAERDHLEEFENTKDGIRDTGSKRHASSKNRGLSSSKGMI